jgi:hypothetical protein
VGERRRRVRNVAAQVLDEGVAGDQDPDGSGGEGGSPLSLAVLLTLQALFNSGDLDPSKDDQPRLVVKPGNGGAPAPGDIDLDPSTAGSLLLLVELSQINPGYVDPEVVVDPRAFLVQAQLRNLQRLAKGIARNKASAVANQMLLYNLALVRQLVVTKA